MVEPPIKDTLVGHNREKDTLEVPNVNLLVYFEPQKRGQPPKNGWSHHVWRFQVGTYQ